MVAGRDLSVAGNVGGGASRGDLKTRVKTARKRSLSSTLWLQRQLNDPYVAQAKRDGYRSRAAYKLIEIDERYHFLKAGQRVVDLGAAPGGWAQVASKKVGAEQGRGKVVGIDLLPIDPLAGVSFAVLDFLDERAPEHLLARAVRVHVGGVEEVDPGVERLPEERSRRRVVQYPVAPFRAAVAHAP